MGGDAGLNYAIDARDRFVSLGDAWLPFALTNGAPELAPERVLGRSFWEFVSDPTTRQIYRDILGRVREGQPASFPLRCDSPDRRRFLEMRIAGDGGGGVRFETTVIVSEPRPPQELWERGAARGTELLRACGWCKRLHVGGAWGEAEEVLRKTGLFERGELPRLTHGMCEPCHEMMLVKIRELR